MLLAARARSITVDRQARLRRPERWTMPFVLAGLALSSACSVDRGGIVPSNATTPSASPIGSEPAPAGSGSPSAETASPAPPPRSAASETTPIRVVVGGRTFTGELYDNATARDLADRLPLTVTMDDLHGTEKTGRLPRALTTDGAPRGADPEVGEIGYYAPGRDLVFYYGEMGYYPGIIRIGRFSEDIERLADVDDGFRARVEVR